MDLTQKLIRGSLWPAVVVVGWLASAAAGEATLEGVRLGAHVTGPPVTVADLAGRVVVFEYWGVNCPPCRAAIPHVSALQAEHGRDQLVVIANHCQGGGAATARAVWQKGASNDLVTVIDGGHLPGSNVRGIPRAFVFDHEGRLVYTGSPTRMDEAVAEAVSRSPGFLVAGRAFSALTTEARALGRMRGNLARTIGRIRAAAASDDPAEKEEAAFLLDRLETWSQRQWDRLERQRTDDPAAALETAEQMRDRLRGDPLGERFDKAYDTMRSDPAVRDAVKAADLLARVIAVADEIGLSTDPEACRANRRHHQRIRQVAAGLEMLERKYPQTPYATKAADCRRQWGL
jgi:thiol-disulfide isomerase/thioredoxin